MLYQNFILKQEYKPARLLSRKVGKRKEIDTQYSEELENKLFNIEYFYWNFRRIKWKNKLHYYTSKQQKIVLF